MIGQDKSKANADITGIDNHMGGGGLGRRTKTGQMGGGVIGMVRTVKGGGTGQDETGQTSETTQSRKHEAKHRLAIWT